MRSNKYLYERKQTTMAESVTHKKRLLLFTLTLAMFFAVFYYQMGLTSFLRQSITIVEYKGGGIRFAQ